jgi:hypothetical protein
MRKDLEDTRRDYALSKRNEAWLQIRVGVGVVMYLYGIERWSAYMYESDYDDKLERGI